MHLILPSQSKDKIPPKIRYIGLKKYFLKPARQLMAIFSRWLFLAILFLMKYFLN